jgi:hypothetical protein
MHSGERDLHFDDLLPNFAFFRAMGISILYQAIGELSIVSTFVLVFQNVLFSIFETWKIPFHGRMKIHADLRQNAHLFLQGDMGNC